MSHDATVKRHGRRMSRRLLGAVVGAVVLAGSAAATASAQQYPITSGDPRIGLAAGPGDTAGKVSLGLQHLSNTPLPPVVNSIELGPGLPGQLRVRRQLQRLQHLRHLQPGGAGAQDGGRLPGRPGRRLGLREPAVRVRRGDAARRRTARSTPAATDATTRFRGIRIFDISNIEPAGPGRRRPDLPRLAHAHAGRRQERPEQRLHLRLRHVRRRSAGDRRPATLQRRPGDQPEPVAVADRGHQGPARRTRAPAAIVNEPRLFRNEPTGARQRPAERAADAVAPVRDRDAACAAHRQPTGGALVAGRHELLPRHHGLRGARPRRRRLRGQRPADRHLRPGEPEAHRRRRRPAVRLLARRDVLQRRQGTSCSPTSGAAAPTRAAARPTS